MTVKISALPAASSANGTDELETNQAGTSRKVTEAQIATYVFSAKTTADLSENTNLYYTSARFDSALATKTTANLTEGANLYYTQARFDTAFAAKTTANLTENTNLYFTTARARTSVSATSPVSYDNSTGVISMPVADSTTNGYMSSALVNILNNKQDIGTGNNYVTNQGIEVDDSDYNTYDDTGRTDAAYVVEQDLTFTSALSGGSGNGVDIEYIYNAGFSSATPDINVISASHVQVRWNNGPTVANNPTATQLKAAWDAVPGALAVATVAISGTAGRRQYITGHHSLANGGDTAPIDGTGTAATGLTISRTTVSPLVGTGSLLISKDAANRQGMGVSIDLTSLNAADLGQNLQLSFYYNAPVGFTVGSASDLKVFVYDVTNAVMIPVTAHNYLIGPTTSTIRFSGIFAASATSSLYRVIWHVATTNATAWDLRVDEIIVNNSIDASAATQVPKLVLDAQPINGSVTDHMAVMWTDGATAWVPATQSGGGDATTLMGFATNLVGLTASVTVRGLLDGFSIGPFLGYNQYIDNVAGGISPAPSTFTDRYWTMGKGVATDSILVDPRYFYRLVTSKGGLLTNTGANDGTGDVVVAGGTTGQILRYNTGLTNGFSAFTPVASAPLAYTAATSTWSIACANSSIFVGNASNVPVAVAMSGDATISNTGAVTIGANKVTNAKSAQMAAHTFKGNNTAGTADPLDLTANQLSAELNSSIVNSSAVAGATVTAALNTLNQNVQEVYLSAIKNAGSVTANTAIASWTTESKDTLNAFDPTTGIFTVPADGDYRVSFNAATTTGTPVAQVYKNGTLVASGIGSGSGVRTSISTIVPNLVVGDTLTVALDSSLTLTSTTTDTILNIIKETGLASAVVNLRRHGATATITGSLSNVTYSTSDFDTHSGYSGSTYTIPTGGSGVYRISAMLYITATTVAAGQAQVLTLMKNGIEFARNTIIASAATGKPFNLMINDIFNFVATDTLTVQVSSASTTPVMSASNTMNLFSLNKISN